MTVDLGSANEKLRWARHHFDQLEMRINGWYERAPHEFQYDIDQHAGTCKVTLRQNERPEAEWPLHVGDVVSNLRAALDHLVYSLACQTRHSPKDTYFPICKDRDTYWLPSKKGRLSLRDRCLKGVPEADRAIIDEYQPYQLNEPYILAEAPANADAIAAAHPLAILNYLSNVDKHRKLHTLLVVPEDVAIFLPYGETVLRLGLDMGGKVVEDGMVIHEGTTGAPSTASARVDASARLVVAFGDLRVPFTHLGIIGKTVEQVLQSYRQPHLPQGIT